MKYVVIDLYYIKIKMYTIYLWRQPKMLYTKGDYI